MRLIFRGLASKSYRPIDKDADESAGHAEAQHWVAEHLASDGKSESASEYFQAAARQQRAPSLLELGHLAKEGRLGASLTDLDLHNMDKKSGIAVKVRPHAG
jgi:hypothetical protein